MKPPALPDLSKVSTRERLLAGAGVLIVCLVLLDRVVLTPWWRYTRRVNEEIRKLDREIAARGIFLSRQAEIQGKVEGFRSVIRLAQSPEVEMANLVREIDTLAVKSGVVLGPVAPQPVTEPLGTYQEHALDVQYQGTLEQAVRFVHALEASTALFRVDRADLELEKRDSDILKGSMRLTSTAMKWAAPGAAP
jgi:Tfp pilus assembly protein PilO